MMYHFDILLFSLDLPAVPSFLDNLTHFPQKIDILILVKALYYLAKVVFFDIFEVILWFII